MKLEEELNIVRFVLNVEYYKAFVDVQSRYNITIPETDHIKIVTKKSNN